MAPTLTLAGMRPISVQPYQELVVFVDPLDELEGETLLFRGTDAMTARPDS